MPMHHYQQSFPTAGTHTGLGAAQPFYYQQPALELYHEPPQYEYRHSPRRYIAEQRTQGASTATGAQRTSTPLHHHHPVSVGYQQDILDRRDYINRPIPTTAVSSAGAGPGPIGSGTTATGSNAALVQNSSTAAAAVAVAAAAAAASLPSLRGESEACVGVNIGGVGKHYNTLPRPLETHHRHTGGSQHSLRASSSTHEIIQNEVGHNEHYIYVTYPPDLKKRYFE